jgi:phage tail P2-like protein
MSNLLPPNATKQEVAQAGTTERITAIPVKTRETWNPQTCPADLLPWLAWALSVDEWNADWSEQQKRDTIAASFVIHSTKGTLSAVKASLAALGYDSSVIEWFQQPADLAPYTFTVDINAGFSPITSDIFGESTRLIEESKNTRSHLARLRVASNAPVLFYGAAAQLYGVYCATGGALSVVGGRPLLLKGGAFAESSASAVLSSSFTGFFAVGDSTSNLVAVYKVEEQTFTKLANPDVMPSSSLNSVDLSVGGNYLAVGSGSTEKIMIYKRNGNAFTKLPALAVQPSNGTQRPKFSPDGVYLAANCTFDAGVFFYKRTGDTFAKLPDPANAGVQTVCVEWNRDGSLVALGGGSTTPGVIVYRRTGDVFAKLTAPTPALPQFSNKMAFSPVSDLLVSGHQNSPFISVTSITGTAHTQHANPADLPPGQPSAIAFNRSGSLCFVGCFGIIIIYSVSGNALTKVADFPLASYTINDLQFNHDGTVLSVGLSGSNPQHRTYAVNGTTLTPISAPPSMPGGGIISVSFSK